MKKTIPLTLIAFTLIHVHPLLHAQDGVTLIPGVIVHEGSIFLMNDQAGVSAIDAKSGKELWSTDTTRFPLGIANRQLICRNEPKRRASVLELATLDTQTGQSIRTFVEELPADVFPSIVETPGVGRFETSVTSRGASAELFWEFRPSPPLQGLPPGTLGSDPPGVSAPAAIQGAGPKRGGFLLNLETGTTSEIPVAADAPPLSAVAVASVANADNRIEGIPGRQYISRDSKHVMVPEQTDDPWNRYRLRIFDRETKEEIGSYPSHALSASFVIRGNLCIYESRRYSRREGGKMVQHPRELKAVDLTSGEKMWSRAIAETDYLGPFPP